MIEEKDNINKKIKDIYSILDEYNESVFKGAIAKVKEEIKKRKLEDLKAKIAKNETVDPAKAEVYIRRKKTQGGHEQSTVLL